MGRAFGVFPGLPLHKDGQSSRLFKPSGVEAFKGSLVAQHHPPCGGELDRCLPFQLRE
jgi:hypothetical protein